MKSLGNTLLLLVALPCGLAAQEGVLLLKKKGPAVDAGEFNGTTSKMVGPAATPPVTGPPFTIWAWIEPVSPLSGDDAVVSVADTAASTGHYFLMEMDDGSELSCFASGGTAVFANVLGVFTVGVKKKVGCIFSSNTLRYACVNSACTSNSANSGVPSGIDLMTLGVRQRLTADIWGKFKMREICLFSAAKTEADFQAWESGAATCPAQGADHRYLDGSGEDLIGTLDLTPTDVTVVTW